MDATDKEKYPHLHGDVKLDADLPDEDRIRILFIDRFIPYDRADEILSELELLYSLEDSIRPQGRLIVGSSLSGKSTILNEFALRYPADDNVEGDAAYVPVLRISVPESPREGIFNEILGKLNVTLPRGSKAQDVRSAAMGLMRDIKMRMLIIDELNNLLEGSTNQQRLVLNSIKMVMNELQRPVVVAGTDDALHAVKTDPQFGSRLQAMPLKPFQRGKSLSGLLRGFESTLPLRKASNLSERKLATKIHLMTGGYIGRISDLLNRAARYAIIHKTEQITEDVLMNCGFELAY